MNNIIFKENVKKSVSIIGSLSCHTENILSGELDEVLSCGIFYSLLERTPEEHETIDTTIVINKLKEFKLKIIAKKDLEEKQRQYNKEIEEKKRQEKIKQDVFDKFIEQNSTSSIGTIKEISIETGLSISYLRKLKKENKFNEFIEEYYPNHICCKRLNYIKLNYLKDNGKKFLKNCIIENKEDEIKLIDLINLLSYTGFNKKDYFYLKKYINVYNKYLKNLA